MLKNAAQKGENSSQQPKQTNDKKQKRSHQNAEKGANTIQDKLADARTQMKTSAKSYILAGISDALEEIAEGNFGDFGDEVFGGFAQLSDNLDQSSRQLVDSRLLPKSLPQSEAESKIKTIEATVI